jgi:hypothetical protein
MPKQCRLTLREFIGTDFADAERFARHLGYHETAYCSTSAVPGLYCHARTAQQHTGVIVQTQELGMLFLQEPRDTGMPADQSERRNGK